MPENTSQATAETESIVGKLGNKNGDSVKVSIHSNHRIVIHNDNKHTLWDSRIPEQRTFERPRTHINHAAPRWQVGLTQVTNKDTSVSPIDTRGAAATKRRIMRNLSLQPDRPFAGAKNASPGVTDVLDHVFILPHA